MVLSLLNSMVMRGGAVSIKAATGLPIKFTGEQKK